MKKFTKRIISVIMATAVVAAMAVSASANTVSGSYSTFTWDNNTCTIKNTTNITRYMTANFQVYEANTGKFVDSTFSSNTGAYGVKSSAVNPVTNSSLYNYIWKGAMYNGNHHYSGVAESYEKP